MKKLSGISFSLHLSTFHQCHIQEDHFSTSNRTFLPCQELLPAHTTGLRLCTAIGKAIIRISLSPRNGGTVVKCWYTSVYFCAVHWNHSRFAGPCLECVQTSENMHKERTLKELKSPWKFMPDPYVFVCVCAHILCQVQWIFSNLHSIQQL